MTNWQLADLPAPPVGPLGWLRVALRGAAMLVVIYGGLGLLALVRLIEQPICGTDRPVTPHITQAVCRVSLIILGLGYSTRGEPMRESGAVVANHGSWLDIFALNAGQRIYFVSKAEVARWPVVGWLARATGTVFIARKGSEAKAQQVLFETRLRAGHRLLFFPEGTSTDAVRVLPFKSTLFAALFSHGLDRVLQVQPVTVIYRAPPGQDARFYGWWGEMTFGGHLLKVLAAPRQGRVEVIFHDPVPVDAFENRKVLAAYCEQIIRTSHPDAPA